MGRYPETVTQLLKNWSDGDQEALNRLMERVQKNLYQIAAKQMRRELRRNHTLQPTALLNEYFIRLVRSKQIQWEDRVHFFGIAARAMRQILVDSARKREGLKRGGKAKQVTLDDAHRIISPKGVDVLALNEALQRLSAKDPRLGRLVELRFFSGLTIEEAAKELNVSPATAKRDWTTARAWLRHELD